jgi:hypothetical protein
MNPTDFNQGNMQHVLAFVLNFTLGDCELYVEFASNKCEHAKWNMV